MIPQHWTPYRRRRDEELVGYLVPSGDAVVPVTLFGYPLAQPVEVGEARKLLESIGLSVLADPWHLEREGESIRVMIREVRPDRMVVVVDDFGYGGNLGDAFVLEVPDTGRLRR